MIFQISYDNFAMFLNKKLKFCLSYKSLRSRAKYLGNLKQYIITSVK